MHSGVDCPESRHASHSRSCHAYLLPRLPPRAQVTLPKSIRQALGADTGSKLAFELRGNEVVVTRADAEHEDPAIAAFLTLLAGDIEAGRNVRGLPEGLVRTMLEHAGHKVELGDDFDEDVDI